MDILNHSDFARMFADVGMPKNPRDDEQAAPASDPTPAPVADARRLAEVSPVNQLLSTHDGSEL